MSSRAVMERQVHGGAHDVGMLDFSTNINPYGPAQVVLDAIRSADPGQYPDPHSHATCNVAASYWAVPRDRVCFTAGATDAIYRCARALLSDGCTAAIGNPAFAEYERAARLAGARIEWIASDSPLRDATTDEICRAICDTRPDVLFLSNPATPLGGLRDAHELSRIARVLSPGILLLDESFLSFAAGTVAQLELRDRPNVVHIRSITKDGALAGVRAGFVVADSQICEAIFAAGIPWSESSVAQAAATAFFDPASVQHIKDSISCIRQTRDVLMRRLTALGFAVYPSLANYVCTSAPHVPDLIERLRERRLAVRDCTSFGLPGTMRIAVRRPEDNEILCAGVESLC
jgi:histidinol-phosphate aminotransferase